MTAPLAQLLMVTVLAASGAGAAKEEICISLTKRLFVHDPQEVVISQSELIGDEIGRRMGRKVTVIYGGDTTAGIVEDLRSGRAQFVFSNALDFVRLRMGRIAPGAVVPPMDVRPLVAVGVVTDSEDLAGCTRSMVVTRKDAGVRTFGDLRNRRFVYSVDSEGDCTMVFLGSLVRKEGYDGAAEFFGQPAPRRLDCYDTCLLSLQSGSADAACIPELTFLAKQMVHGGELKYVEHLAKSDHHTAYLCFYLADKVPPGLAEELRYELLRAHDTERLARLLKQINVERFVPVDAANLAPIEAMLEQAEPDKEGTEPAGVRASPAQATGGARAPDARAGATAVPH